MKKILILLILSFIPPVYSMCSIDSETSCSLADSTNILPNFTNQTQNENLENKPLELQPVLNNHASKSTLQNFGQQSSDFSYNSSCQFGVCNQTGAPVLFNNSGK